MSNSAFTVAGTAIGTGSVTAVGTGTGLSGGTITTTGTIEIANTTVTPGSYSSANITVNAQGQLTFASNGSSGSVTSITAGTGLTSSPNPITSTGTISLTVPVVVADGGTGITTATPYAVVCGGTTSTGAFQDVSGVGSSGQVLTSNGAGFLPAGKVLAVVVEAVGLFHLLGILRVDQAVAFKQRRGLQINWLRGPIWLGPPT